MKVYVGVTDQDWFDFLGALAGIDEVNFWQPSADDPFKAIGKGDMFLFKLHRGVRTGHRDLIAGGGILSSFSILPVSLAWEAFGVRNGAPSFSEMRKRLIRYRRIDDRLNEDFKVGCIILTQPFFFEESSWFPAPDWKPQIVQGKSKGYELNKEAGRFIWTHVQRGLEARKMSDLFNETQRVAEERERFGRETIIRPRLGQGSFKIAVTDAYVRSCAITEEHSLPALEAAHIKPYSENGPHEISNGLLLRSDFHRLFDRGYITVTPEYRIEISRRIKEEFENGRSYYPFQGMPLNHLPKDRADHPDASMLIWHNENRYLG